MNTVSSELYLVFKGLSLFGGTLSQESRMQILLPSTKRKFACPREFSALI